MDYTAIIVAALSTLTSIGVALVGIIPAIKKNSIKSEELSALIKKEIEAALESSETIKGIQQSSDLLKNGLKSEMRATLLRRYLEFEKREFALTDQEYKEWNEDVKIYHDLSGNGTITAADSNLQIQYELYLLKHS